VIIDFIDFTDIESGGGDGDNDAESTPCMFIPITIYHKY
jgi:hypothetical protein